MTQALNYCRDMVAQSERFLSRADCPAGIRTAIETAVHIAAVATKFVLPPNGRMIDDNELKALPDGPLNLPYTNMVLEYFRTAESKSTPPPPGWIDLAKCIVFARQESDRVVLIVSDYWPEKDLWVTDRFFSIPRENYAKPDAANPRGKPLLTFTADANPDTSIPIERYDQHMAWAGWILLSFLNALACSNVEVQQADNPAADRHAKLSPRKQARKLPPDLYHVLTVKLNPTARGMAQGAGMGDRHQVREHLRRGHIRRLVSGARIWVNSTIVMPGSTSGQVSKDYRVVA